MDNVKPLRWIDLAWLFGIPTLLNLVACRIAIPFLERRGWFPIEINYFLSVGLLVLAPMLAWAVWLSGRETGSYRPAAILGRMRIRRLSRTDWLWAVAAFMFLTAASYLIAKVAVPALGIDATPFFFRNMPLQGRYFLILYAWPVFFFFNIFGEECLWRGYIQPRQELLNGRWTWLVHGLCWAGWHLPMGIDLVISATPIFFILPAVVQIRKNTTIAIVVHTVFGAFGFLVLAFGAVH